VRTIGVCDVAAGEWIEKCHSASSRELVSLPTQILEDARLPEYIRNNLQLLLAQALTAHQYYDEAASYLARLNPESVADPASLLFYQSAVLYRQRDKERGLSVLARLLENEDQLPKRFANVGRLMLADLREYEEDSLDEVSRIMDSVRVRLGHGRAGKKVRNEESLVVKKLDKMIEELEKRQQQAQGQGAAGGLQSNSPAADSALAGGKGAGDIDRRNLDKDANWGDLPPKDREQALQQLGHDFPSHYRDIVEEYFRSLAQENSAPE
jgi:hypothetical protein